MEKMIYNALRRIEQKKSPHDIRFVNIQIGKYRLNAQSQKGYVRYHIHQQANEIERELKLVLYKG